MQIMSWNFALFVLVGLVLFHACRGVLWRRSILALMNLLFLASFADSWLELAPLAGFLALSVVAIKLLNRCREGSLLIVCILVMLFAYLFLKRYAVTGFLDPLDFNYVAIGLSYIIFRVLHVLIDVLQMPDQNLNLSSWKLVRYFTSFLTLTAGPVQRYEDFLEQDEKLAEGSQLSADDVRWAFVRLTDGLFRLAFVSPLMMKAFQFTYVRMPSYKLAFGGAALCYMLFIFFNFSGYMGIVIGIGRLFGQRLPENFNSPFLAKNFLDLWSRWHITVSQWFKTYVFNNLVHFLCSRWGSPARLPYMGVAGYFVAFFLLGIWHDWGHCFLLLGLLQGLGVSINKLWEVQLRRRLGPQRYTALIGRSWYQIWARGMALGYFTMSTVPAWDHANYADLLGYVHVIGIWGLVLNFFACVLGFMAVEVGVRRCWRLAQGVLDWRQRLPADFRVQLALSARVFAVLVFALPDAPATGPQRGIVRKLAIGNAQDAQIMNAANIFYGSKR